ncbi:hypothetical protein QBC47DRAFT_411290 [Echria macrotheca]|uniref:Uncharacterized protein n=1 Tax=Echria macrotheca TaxID=438768 RepID=A0AAJ0F821_9PEZI|nr:hypothetical protein QBC47DRAFT_411290 [Echria macrotheca]
MVEGTAADRVPSPFLCIYQEDTHHNLRSLLPLPNNHTLSFLEIEKRGNPQIAGNCRNTRSITGTDIRLYVRVWATNSRNIPSPTHSVVRPRQATMTSFSPSAAGSGTRKLSKVDIAMAETSIIVHAPPDMPRDAEILGVLGLAQKHATGQRYGWMVTDYLAWKILFRNCGNPSNKHWLSALDLNAFAEEHDFPEESRVTIFGEGGKDIQKLACDNDEFTQNLRDHIASRARAANSRNTSLVLIIESPVTPEGDICIELGESPKKAFITIDSIRDDIRTAVSHSNLPVTLVTVSPFTGGWACYPSLFPAAPTATSDKLLQFVAMSCGGVFADTFMNVFTRRGTPLLTDAERAKVRYDDMMPVGPTDHQTSLLHKFQRGIHECLEHRFCELGKTHGLNFQPKHDIWSRFAPRHGIDLQYWKAEWGPADETDHDLEEHPHYQFLGEAFGGSRFSQMFHLKYLVAIEADTCPVDWERNMTGITNELFAQFAQNPNPSTDEFKRVFDTVEYRGSLMLLANILVKALKLPVPASCRFWDDKTREDELYVKQQAAWGRVHELFPPAPLLPGENRHPFKCVRFYRPARWIAAGIALKFEHQPKDEVMDFVKTEVAPLIAKLREIQMNLLRENPTIVSMGRAWIASLHLGIDEHRTQASRSSSFSPAGYIPENGVAQVALDRQEQLTKTRPMQVGNAGEKKPLFTMPAQPIQVKSPEEEKPLFPMPLKQDTANMERKDRIKAALVTLEGRKLHPETAKRDASSEADWKTKTDESAHRSPVVVETAVAPRAIDKEPPAAHSRDNDKPAVVQASKDTGLVTDWEKFMKAAPLANYTAKSPSAQTPGPQRVLSSHWENVQELPVQSVADNDMAVPSPQVKVKQPGGQVVVKEAPEQKMKLVETPGVIKPIMSSMQKVEPLAENNSEFSAPKENRAMHTPPSVSPTSASARKPSTVPVFKTVSLQLTPNSTFPKLRAGSATTQTSTPRTAPIDTPARSETSRGQVDSTAVIQGLREITNILAEDPARVLDVLRGLGINSAATTPSRTYGDASDLGGVSGSAMASGSPKGSQAVDLNIQPEKTDSVDFDKPVYDNSYQEW